MLRIWVALVPFLALNAAEIPAGTELHIRLKDKVDSSTAEPKQAVRAVLIAPVTRNGAVVIPAGAEVSGVVREAAAAPTAETASEDKKRAVLDLDFNQLQAQHISARVTEVENARETVDENGKIEGVIASEMLASRIDQGIQKLSQKYSGFAGILQGIKGAVIKDADANISYDAGIEMTLKLLKPVTVTPTRAPQLDSFPDERRLVVLANREPFQTFALRPHRASDVTNLMFIGSEDQLEEAFAAAGWSSAARLNGLSKFETAIAIIEQRGYKEAPVSVLLLDERPPDLVFQKGANTFAARHHLRIWRMTDMFAGKPVWVSSATHDIGIDFSQQDMTFIHKIDSNIDLERAKVVNDLVFTGQVRSFLTLDRPDVPRQSQNATGDKIATDGKIAALLFK